MSFSSTYPNLTRWASFGGRVEIHCGLGFRKLVSLGDAGGYAWQSKQSHGTVDEALHEAEVAVSQILIEYERLQAEFDPMHSKGTFTGLRPPLHFDPLQSYDRDTST